MTQSICARRELKKVVYLPATLLAIMLCRVPVAAVHIGFVFDEFDVDSVGTGQWTLKANRGGYSVSGSNLILGIREAGMGSSVIIFRPFLLVDATRVFVRVRAETLYRFSIGLGSGGVLSPGPARSVSIQFSDWGIGLVTEAFLTRVADAVAGTWFLLALDVMPTDQDAMRVEIAIYDSQNRLAGNKAFPNVPVPPDAIRFLWLAVWTDGSGNPASTYQVDWVLVSTGGLSEVARGLLESLAGLQRQFGSLQTNLTAIHARLVSIDGNIGTLRSDLGTLRVNLTAINARLMAIEGRTARLGTDLGNILVELRVLRPRLTAIEGDLATITTRMGTIQADLSVLKPTIEKIEGRLATLRTDLGKIQVDLSALNPRLTKIEGDVAVLQTKVGIVQVDLGALKPIITKINGTLATVNTLVGEMQGRVIMVQGRTAMIETDVGQVKASLGETAKQVATVAGIYHPLGLLLLVVVAALVVLMVSGRGRKAVPSS